MALMSEEEMFADLKGCVQESSSQIQRAQVALLSKLYRDQKVRLGMQRRTSREMQMRELYKARQKAAEMEIYEAALRSQQHTPETSTRRPDTREAQEARAAAKAAYDTQRAADEEVIAQLKTRSRGIESKIRRRAGQLAAAAGAVEDEARQGGPSRRVSTVAPAMTEAEVAAAQEESRAATEDDAEIARLEMRVDASLSRIRVHRATMEDRKERGRMEHAALEGLRDIHAAEYKARRAVAAGWMSGWGALLRECRREAQFVDLPPSPTEVELTAKHDRIYRAMAKHEEALREADVLLALKKQPIMAEYYSPESDTSLNTAQEATAVPALPMTLPPLV